MKPQLGISVYFQDLDLDYLESAYQAGVSSIFTSLHIPEEDFTDFDDKFALLNTFASSHGMHIICDISPHTFEKFELQNMDVEGLKSVGFDTVRLDFGFDDFEGVKALSENFHLIMNASIITPEYVQAATEFGIDCSKWVLSHNFYPKLGTGLTVEDFMKKNDKFKDLDLTIQAFVAGNRLMRFPFYEGLPTLEKHRGMNPYVAFVDLHKNFKVDLIHFGDSMVFQKELDAIQSYMETGIITIAAHLNEPYKHLYHEEIQVRTDQAEAFIRLGLPRKAQAPMNQALRFPGAITMDNDLYGRYSGEVQIMKESMGYDARVNLIGFVAPSHLELLKMVDGADTIKFVPLD